jgi:hypothetical protein
MKKRQYDRLKVQIFKKPENTGIASLALILAKLINKVKKYRLGIIKLKNYRNHSPQSASSGRFAVMKQVKRNFFVKKFK